MTVDKSRHDLVRVFSPSHCLGAGVIGVNPVHRAHCPPPTDPTTIHHIHHIHHQSIRRLQNRNCPSPPECPNRELQPLALTLSCLYQYFVISSFFFFLFLFLWSSRLTSFISPLILVLFVLFYEFYPSIPFDLMKMISILSQSMSLSAGRWICSA